MAAALALGWRSGGVATIRVLAVISGRADLSHRSISSSPSGEKLVFWAVVGAGSAVAVSGYLLLFPFYVTNIVGMQIAQVVHSIVALSSGRFALTGY
jgi:cytochrome b subunit of formate dehydrogenase